MLVLTRRAGESIVIGDDVRVVVLDVRGETVRLGIEAPRSVQVHRAEIYAEVQAANAAALAQGGDLGALTGRLAALAQPVRRSPRDAARASARRMVRMSEGNRLDRVQGSIDEAKEAAAAAQPDLLPHGPSAGDPRSGEAGTFEPSGDESDAGESPSEGADARTPGDA